MWRASSKRPRSGGWRPWQSLTCLLYTSINPTNDGNVIRLVFPELTEERRKDLAKDVKKKGEGAKVAVRNIRRDAMDSIKKMEKAGDISEDDLKQGEEKIQKITDKMIENCLLYTSRCV